MQIESVMKKASVIIAALLLQGALVLSQVAINMDSTPPDFSAMLDVQSTLKGLLVPRMSMSERNAIPLPSSGLLVFQNDATPGLYYNAGSKMLPNWKLVGNNAGPWLFNGTTIYYNAGSVGIGTSSPAAKFHVSGGDAIINGLTVGRGPWNVSNNTVLGTQALYNGDGGTGVTAIGAMALANATEQSDLVAVGDSALYYNGLNAVQSYHGTENTAVGPKALYFNTTGYRNTALGYRALYSNTGGYYNTAVGNNALACNTLGDYNTANGYLALQSNTMGNYNAAFGNASLQHNTYGTNNAAFGYATLCQNTTGLYNTALGSRALYSDTTGYANTACGYFSLYLNASGNYNTAAGFNSLHSNATGLYNTAMGTEALYSNTTGSSNVAIGLRALYSNTTRSDLVAVGDSALYNNGLNISQSYHATSNTAIGSRALYANTNGHKNTAIGSEALYSNISGYDNSAVGYKALYLNIQGSHSVAFGSGALESMEGYYSFGNSALGSGSLQDLTEGNGNTAIGYLSLYYLSGADADYNVGVGYESGPYLWSGNSHCSYGTMIGAFAGVSQYAGNVTALGYSAETDASHQVRIGNESVTSIGGYAGWTTLTTDGSYQFNVRENVAGLDFILKLRPVTFQMDVDKLVDLRSERRMHRPDILKNERHIRMEAEGRQQKSMEVYSGFVAQEVEKAALETGYDFSGLDAPKSESGLYGLRYAEFVVPLVKAIQEQQEMIEELKTTNAMLSERIDNLEKELLRR